MILQTQCPKPRNLDALSSFCLKKNRAWFNLVCAIGFTTLILPGSVPVSQVDTYFTIVHSPNLWWLKFPCSAYIASNRGRAVTTLPSWTPALCHLRSPLSRTRPKPGRCCDPAMATCPCTPGRQGAYGYGYYMLLGYY